MSDYKILPVGDTALVVEFGNTIDRELSSRVLALSQSLDQQSLFGITELVPTFRSLMVHYDPVVLPPAALMSHIRCAVQGTATRRTSSRTWCLPVCYDDLIAPDLLDVARRTSLSPEDVIEHHSSTSYRVYMLGFLPGFAYLGDLPAQLVLPRRDAPRARVPAGVLGIATTLTGVYPLETPSGWHIIGRCPVPLWAGSVEPERLLAPGDTVTFKPVSLKEYERLFENRNRLKATDYSRAIESLAA